MWGVVPSRTDNHQTAAACAALQAPSPDREDAESLVADQGAVAVIGDRLVREGATLCDSSAARSGADRTCAHRATACGSDPLPDSPKRSTHRPATSAFAASSGT